MYAPMKDLVLSSVVAYVKCIDYLIGKVSKRVAMLSRMRKNIMYTAGTVYKPFVLPIIDYCDTVCNCRGSVELISCRGAQHVS